MTGIKLAARIARALTVIDSDLSTFVSSTYPHVVHVTDEEGREFTVIVHRKEDSE